MYMKQYTVAELRQKTRQIFNEAEQEPITITRYGEEFYLFKAGDLMLPKTLAPAVLSDKKVPRKRNVSKNFEGKEKTQGVVIHNENPVTPESGKPIITEKNKDMEFCKHGAVKGLCKKGCK